MAYWRLFIMTFLDIISPMDSKSSHRCLSEDPPGVVADFYAHRAESFSSSWSFLAHLWVSPLYDGGTSTVTKRVL
jgi:hypothetical protein